MRALKSEGLRVRQHKVYYANVQLRKVRNVLLNRVCKYTTFSTIYLSL